MGKNSIWRLGRITKNIRVGDVARNALMLHSAHLSSRTPDSTCTSHEHRDPFLCNLPQRKTMRMNTAVR